MAISAQQATAEELAFFKKSVDNAVRLSEDAKLLCENSRAYSAIMVAILAIEEMGKALIIGWGVKNAASKRAYPTHIEKQSATFALLSAYEISKMSKSRLRRKLDKTGGNFNEMGPLSLQFSYARSGFFENLRMTVTYADEKPIYPLQEIDDGNFVDLAVELLKWFKIAQHAIKNAVAMDLASTFFENDLGRM